MRRRAFFVAFALTALLLAGVVSLFASGSPDGLERVAAEKGIDDTAREHALGEGPMSDYAVKAVDHELLSGGLAGVVGVLVVLALTSAVVLAVRRRGVGGRGR